MSLKPIIRTVCLAFLVVSSSAHGAASIQGFMFSDGVTGQGGAPVHNWDREIVYVSAQGSGGVGGGFRMLAQEPGWFFIQPTGGFPAGRYTMFSMNVGNVDGGCIAFDYGTSFDVPGGSGKIENLQFKTHEHYSVMYNRNYTEWTSEPWIWGSDFYQTFIATNNSVTRIATKLADKNAGPGTHHLTLVLNYAIYSTNAGPPSTWTRISPIRSRFLPGNMDPIIHILDVNYLSSETVLVTGQKYAVRFWVGAGSQSTQFAMVARPDTGNGYPDGIAYVSDTPYSNWDIYGYISGGPPGTLVNFGPTNQEKPQSDTFLGTANKHGQTFQASGNGLAAVELMYSVGCNPNPSLRISMQLYNAPNGTPIGPAKACYSVTDLCQGRVAAYWEPGEVPLTPGATYYIEFDSTSAGGVNTWRMDNDIPNVGAYVNGVSAGSADLTMTLAEYTGGDIPTPRPTNSPTITPTPTLSPTPVNQPNLLKNGNMEQGPAGTGGASPDFWTKWTGSGNPTYWHNSDCGRSGLGARLIGGAINGTKFDAGLYQSVTGLTPGKTYGLFGWVRFTPRLSGEYEARVGYDLSGQTSNGLAATIQYIQTGGDDAYDVMPLVTFIPTGSTVTIWLRAHNTSTAEIFWVDFDDFMLYEIPDLQPTPTPQPNKSTISVY